MMIGKGIGERVIFFINRIEDYHHPPKKKVWESLIAQMQGNEVSLFFTVNYKRAMLLTKIKSSGLNVFKSSAVFKYVLVGTSI